MKQECVYYEYEETDEANTFERKKNKAGEYAESIVVGKQYYNSQIVRAKIGAEMELDAELNLKYEDYVCSYGNFITGEGNTEQVPIAFYVGDRNSFADNDYEVKKYVKAFFENGSKHS